MRRSCLVLSLLFGPALPLALAGQVPTDRTRAGEGRDRAIKTGDMVVWEQFTSAEFTVVDRAGRLFTRADQLVQLRTIQSVELRGQPLLYGRWDSSGRRRRTWRVLSVRRPPFWRFRQRHSRHSALPHGKRLEAGGLDEDEFWVAGDRRSVHGRVIEASARVDTRVRETGTGDSTSDRDERQSGMVGG